MVQETLLTEARDGVGRVTTHRSNVRDGLLLGRTEPSNPQAGRGCRAESVRVSAQRLTHSAVNTVEGG